MAVSYFSSGEGASIVRCLSSDTKPTVVPNLATLVEEDTGKHFRYENSVWVEKLNSSYYAGTTVLVSDITGTISVAKGGTNASSAASARTNLGLGDVSTINTNASTSNYLRGDGTWVTPPGGSEAFPIGAVFISVVSASPATLLGYGTWSAFGSGRVLVGLDSGDTDFDTAEETGGAKTHTLTTDEIPAHTHTQDAHTHAMTNLRGATTGGTTTGYGGIVAGNDTSSTTTPWLPATTVATNQNTGGGNTHNNVQPYIVVYMWKRTA